MEKYELKNYIEHIAHLVYNIKDLNKDYFKDGLIEKMIDDLINYTFMLKDYYITFYENN